MFTVIVMAKCEKCGIEYECTIPGKSVIEVTNPSARLLKAQVEFDLPPGWHSRWPKEFDEIWDGHDLSGLAVRCEKCVV